MKRFSLACLLLWPMLSLAQTPMDKSPLNTATLISPYYFGPNAFPVPQMLDGRVERELRVELAGDYFHGNRGDHTEDVSLKLNIPLWTERANLTVWMPVMEWFRNSDQNIQTCRIQPQHQADAKKGSLMGDVFLSIDMHLMKQRHMSSLLRWL